MALGDWMKDGSSGAQSPATAALSAYQRTLQINARVSADYEGSDPWTALSGLRLLAEDKSFLHGAIGILQLPDAVTYALLLTYRKKWEQAMKRHTYLNGAENAGRRAANQWILNGALGFIDWQDADKPP